MRIALDISSTQSGHQFRGIGFYTERLYKNLAKLTIQKKDFTLVPFVHKIPSADLYHFPAFSPFFMSFPLQLVNKSIITIHDLIPLQYSEHFPAGLRGNIKWNIQKNFLKYSKSIITDSVASQSSINQITGVSKEKIKVIYLAADNLFKPQKNNHDFSLVVKKYALPDKFLLYVGDFNWNKNVIMLARACIKSNFPLVVVGKQAVAKNIDRMHPWNSELAQFQMLADERPDIIKRTGYVETKDLVEVYNIATALVHPAIAEGFGLTVLEAMQSGCPVITSNQSSLPEITKDCAKLINPSSKSELESAILEIWNDHDLRKKLSESGIERASHFSWEKTALETYQTYTSVFENI